MKMIEDVARCMIAAGQKSDGPTASLYLELIREETRELSVALAALENMKPDTPREELARLWTEVFDGVLDTVWVYIGFGIACDFPMAGGWHEVAASNFSKFPPCPRCNGSGTVWITEHEGDHCEACSGTGLGAPTPHPEIPGKYGKPPGYFKPRLYEMILAGIPKREEPEEPVEDGRFELVQEGEPGYIDDLLKQEPVNMGALEELPKEDAVMPYPPDYIRPRDEAGKE